MAYVNGCICVRCINMSVCDVFVCGVNLYGVCGGVIFACGMNLCGGVCVHMLMVCMEAKRGIPNTDKIGIHLTAKLNKAFALLDARTKFGSERAQRMAVV